MQINLNEVIMAKSEVSKYTPIIFRIERWQEDLYNTHTTQNNNRFIARISYFPVYLIDKTLDFAKYPLSAIENIVVAIFHTIAAIFSKNYKFSQVKNDLTEVAKDIGCTTLMPLTALIDVPVDIFVKIPWAMYEPENLRSVCRLSLFQTIRDKFRNST